VALERVDGGAQLEALLRGEVHVVLGRREVIDERVMVKRLRWEPLWLVLPREHRLAPSATVALEAIARDPFVVPARAASPALYDTMLGLCRSAGFSPQIAYTVDRIDLVPAYVAANLGVGLVPDYFSVAGQHYACFRPIAELPAWLELVASYLVSDPPAVLLPFVEVAAKVARMGLLSQFGSPGQSGPNSSRLGGA
jgi:DNA-binding transcriptional LysR family regulator